MAGVSFGSSISEEQPPDHEQNWEQVGQGVLEDITDKSRGMHLLVAGDGLDHEIGSIADVGVRLEEYRSDVDGKGVVVKNGLTQNRVK